MGGYRNLFGLVLEPVIQRRLKGFPVLCVAYTVNPSYHLCCHLPLYLTLSLSQSSPCPLLTICSPFPSHTMAISPSITPSYHHPSVYFPYSSTLMLFFYSLLPWFHLSISFFQSALLHLFIPSSFLFWVLLSTPQGRGMGLMNMESPEQISLSICRYTSLCPSDRQQKTKCLLSETFLISFYPHPSPLHYPPHLVMESLFLEPVHPAETCRVFQLHFFSKIPPVRVPNFYIFSPSSLPCPPLQPI